MAHRYYLAIDIGASSGRHILAHKENETIVLEEVYRFKNRVVRKDGKIVWDIDSLIKNILLGMKKCNEIGKIPMSVGIDTFGVDYALLNDKDERLGDVYSYRDTRTVKSREAFNQRISAQEQFNITGVQPQLYNTIYQLYDDVLNDRLKQVKSILLLPSYLNFHLTGVKRNEYTIATTTGLLNHETKKWDETLLSHLGLKKDHFPELIMPGEKLGSMREEIQKIIGYDTTLYTVGSHDTASSVLGSLADEETLFLSSGTWSLIGVLSDERYTNEAALKDGFSNEGSPFGKVRFLKNIMGLWMIQEINREQKERYPIEKVIEMAQNSRHFSGIVDVNDERFLSPKSMMRTIDEILKETSQPQPKTLGEYYYCVYHSLAYAYDQAIKQIEKMTGKNYLRLNIIGGGSQNTLLNELTEKLSGKEIMSGPTESTALGNIVMQMIASGEIQDYIQAKTYVKACLEFEKQRE
ncbi:MAG: rhamnulokinase family protein [Acholeplasmataceae bacterium]|nr:rhamnulokinase [Acholeplasmataceae bacterium]